MAEQYRISTALVAEERSYVLKVDGYSRAKALLKSGNFVYCTTPFNVGGHCWAVIYYPNGFDEGDADFVDLYLFLESSDVKDLEVKFTLSVLDKNGQPVPSFSRTGTFPVKDSASGCFIPLVKIAGFRKADLEGSVHLRNDCLSIRCDITVMKEMHKEETRVPPTDLHLHLGDLLKNTDAADVTFQVGGQRFSAHRCVLAARSSVFKAELLGAMKENSSSPIEILDMEADVFKYLLHFIYTDTVPPALQTTSNKGAQARGDLAMAGHLLVAADRYNIGRLKLICEEKLCNQIDCDMVATSLALAEQHAFHDLKEASLIFLTSPSNLEAMMASDGFEHLKSSCPSVLKELIARTLPAELKATKDLIMAIW